MRKYEFTNELTEKAFNVYSNSDFTFYKEKDTFFVADNQNSEPRELGTLEDVEEYLLIFAE